MTICTTLIQYLVRAEFELTVNFINYTNPTGLCAECLTKLDNVTYASADQLIPVCCDEPRTNSSDNCNNTGEARCDTRFRWTIRPFGASLETRPYNQDAYYFTDCSMSSTTCPFSEMSTTFSQGPIGFLGVAANPLPVVSILTSWSVSHYLDTVPLIISFPYMPTHKHNIHKGNSKEHDILYTTIFSDKCDSFVNVVYCRGGFTICNTTYAGVNVSLRRNWTRVYSCAKLHCVFASYCDTEPTLILKTRHLIGLGGW